MLTGLANRNLFGEILSRQLALCRLSGDPLTVAYIDLAARRGGDELAVILTRAGPEMARAVCDKLHGLLAAPYAIGSREVRVSASIGIATHPECGDTADALSQRAARQSTRAKSAGKCRLALAA